MLKKLKVRKTNLFTEINNWLKVAVFFIQMVTQISLM